MTNRRNTEKIISLSAVLVCIILFNPLSSYAAVQNKTRTDSVKPSVSRDVNQTKKTDIIDRLSKGSVGWREKGFKSTGDVVKFALFWLLVLFIGTGITTFIRYHFFKGKRNR